MSDLRHGLRGRIQASTLGDARAFTRELKDAYRELWRRRCNNVWRGIHAAEYAALIAYAL